VNESREEKTGNFVGVVEKLSAFPVSDTKSDRQSFGIGFVVVQAD